MGCEECQQGVTLDEHVNQLRRLRVVEEETVTVEQIGLEHDGINQCYFFFWYRFMY
jgi:hypothetical protein